MSCSLVAVKLYAVKALKETVGVLGFGIFFFLGDDFLGVLGEELSKLDFRFFAGEDVGVTRFHRALIGAPDAAGTLASWLSSTT